MRGAINAVCHSIFLAAGAGAEKGLDPGRPHVPPFGRKLYHLRHKAPKSGNFDERMVRRSKGKADFPSPLWFSRTLWMVGAIITTHSSHGSPQRGLRPLSWITMERFAHPPDE
jgi:hypothetical protein